MAAVLDKVKSLGFHYATQAGVTISKNDVVIPPDKEEILEGFEGEVRTIEDQYFRGLITDEERKEAVVSKWTEATDAVADAMERNLDELNPIFMMANSGARGSMKQIRQLAGMRGLMANPKGDIIERPIKANFMEGLSVLEYFISTHGARKGLADTALRTADSGYLTRRLVDVAQDVIIRIEDCKTEEGIVLPLTSVDGPNRSLYGRRLAEDVRKPLASGKPGKTVLAERGEILTKALVDELMEELDDDTMISARSVLKCRVRARRVSRVLRDLPRHRRDRRDRRRGRDHRRAVDRRAGHAAHDAHLPHGRRRRRGHHARPAARRRDLRGAQPEGRRGARRDRRPRHGRGDRARAEDHDHARRLRGGGEGVRSSRAAPGCSSRRATSSPRATR